MAVFHVVRSTRMIWKRIQGLSHSSNLTALIIFLPPALLLFTMFGNFKDAGLVFLNVPFAIVGGIAAKFFFGWLKAALAATQ